MKKLIFLSFALLVAVSTEAKFKLPQKFRLKLNEEYYLDEVADTIISSRVISDENRGIIVSLTDGYVFYDGETYPQITGFEKMKRKKYAIGAYKPSGGIAIIIEKQKKWLYVQVSHTSVPNSPWIYYIAEIEEFKN